MKPKRIIQLDHTTSRAEAVDVDTYLATVDANDSRDHVEALRDLIEGKKIIKGHYTYYLVYADY